MPIAVMCDSSSIVDYYSLAKSQRRTDYQKGTRRKPKSKSDFRFKNKSCKRCFFCLYRFFDVSLLYGLQLLGLSMG